MSLGNDMVLCPVCEGKRGNMGCQYCKGEGRTTTFVVDYVDKNTRGEKWKFRAHPSDDCHTYD